MSLLRPKNGLDRMSDPKLTQKTTFIISQMAGRPEFPEPSPSLAELTTALNDFKDAVSAALTRDTNKVNEKNAKKQVLVDLLHLEIYYVLFAAQGQLSVAELSGFSFAKLSPSPFGPIAQPTNLKVVNSNQSGNMKVSVNKVAGAVAYMHQYTTDPTLKEGSWITVTCTKTKCTVTGLTPGVTYYWRVAAIGANDQVMYSDVVSRVAA